MVKGRFGIFGGQYVPQILMAELEAVETAYKQALEDPLSKSSWTGCSKTMPAAPPASTGRTR